MKEHIYHIKGMHCASCEILIEKKLLELGNVKLVEASITKGEALIEYEDKRPTAERLNEIFKKEGYQFFDKPEKNAEQKENGNFFVIACAVLFVIIGFSLIKDSGFAGLINVSSTSSLSMFFLLGLLAGVSSCAALVGGLILSMSKQWLGLYAEKESTLKKLQPHLMFNAGRLVSYAVLGGIIGTIGSKFQISSSFTSILIIAVSALMFFLAFQMLGVKAFRRFQFTMPKFITRRLADETKFQGKYTPFIMGALTFFLPCGFTVTAQGLALISGGAIQGALIMLFFALGTLPSLLTIGLSSVKFLQKPHLSEKFLKIAGVLVLFFALYNINAQLNVLGFSSFSDIKLNPGSQTSTGNNPEGLPKIVNGKQILRMNASSRGYSPNYLKVRVGLPVRWEINDTGTSGCTNAVISKSLFEGAIPLTPGQTSTKEFTPEKPGKYKFSCWMGMVSGIVEVVGEGGNENLFTPSGAESSGGSCGLNGKCGCGGR